MKRCIVETIRNETDLRRFVRTCDERLDRSIEETVNGLERIPDLCLIGLTGPSCSGKTTAAKKITEYLERKGFRVHIISIDDFYFDKDYLNHRSCERRDVEIDYDSEQTIDVDLLAEKTDALLRGVATRLPKFDFSVGKRIPGERIVPQREDVFLFEGIQLLYPRVNAILNRSSAYRCFYISPETAIEVGGELFLPNEIRLCRRLVRDFHRRATAPEFTFYLWKSVRINEETSIFPQLHLCHGRIDSTMCYEIGMLKPYLEQVLAQIPPAHPAIEEAARLLRKLQRVQPIPSDYMTENSLYKEFI